MLTIQNNWVQHWQTNRLELGTVSEFPLGVFPGWQWVAPGLHYGRLHNLGSHNVKLHNKGWEYKIWEKTKLKNCYRAQAGKQHQLSFLVKRFVFSTKICFFKKICQIFHQKHFFRISIFSLKFVQFCWKVSYLAQYFHFKAFLLGTYPSIQSLGVFDWKLNGLIGPSGKYWWRCGKVVRGAPLE